MKSKVLQSVLLDLVKNIKYEYNASDEEMAKHLSITKSTYERLEKGQVEILYSDIAKLRKGFAIERWDDGRI